MSAGTLGSAARSAAEVDSATDGTRRFFHSENASSPTAGYTVPGGGGRASRSRRFNERALGTHGSNHFSRCSSRLKSVCRYTPFLTLRFLTMPEWKGPRPAELEELERAVEGAPNTWDCTAEGELVALSWAVATVDLTRSSGAAPKQMLLWPPGGAWRRVVGRSVMTLPQFWSEPLAKALDDCETGVGMRGAVSASRDC